MRVVDAQREIPLDLVSSRLAQYLREFAGSSLHKIEVAQTLARPYSLTLFLEVIADSGTRRVVLKRIKNHPLNDSVVDELDQSSVEFGILEKLYPKYLDIPQCSVPRPILLIPEINAYMMEYVDGNLLSDCLYLVHYWSSGKKFAQLCERFYTCGVWLRHFQQFSGLRLADVNALDNLLVRCENRLKVIEKACIPECQQGFRQSAARFIERQVARLGSAEILVTGRHGDFGPWNTLVGTKGVTVIDFFGYREDPLPVDIFSVLVYLDAQKFGLANSRFRIDELQDRFLSGYGAVPALPEPLILLCEAQQRILQIASKVLATHEAGFKRWERFGSLRENIQWFNKAPDVSRLWSRAQAIKSDRL